MRFNELCGVYKEAFDFCFEQVSSLGMGAFISLDTAIAEAERSEISIESSPFFVIINFTGDELWKIVTTKSVDIVVYHVENASGRRIPTIFIMHFNQDKLVEIEFYNADSSAMDLDEIFVVRKIYVNCYENGKEISKYEKLS